MEAIAFIARKPIEEVAVDAMSASDYKCDSFGDLLEDAYSQLNPQDDVGAMVARTKKYRDASGIRYPDFRIENEIDCLVGEIDDDDLVILNEAAKILA